MLDKNIITEITEDYRTRDLGKLLNLMDSVKVDLPSVPKLQYLYYLDGDIIEFSNGENKNISQEIRELKHEINNLEKSYTLIEDRLKNSNINSIKILENIDKIINICHDNKSCDTCKFYCGTSLCTTKKIEEVRKILKEKKYNR